MNPSHHVQAYCSGAKSDVTMYECRFQKWGTIPHFKKRGYCTPRTPLILRLCPCTDNYAHNTDPNPNHNPDHSPNHNHA